MKFFVWCAKCKKLANLGRAMRPDGRSSVFTAMCHGELEVRETSSDFILDAHEHGETALHGVAFDKT